METIQEKRRLGDDEPSVDEHDQGQYEVEENLLNLYLVQTKLSLSVLTQLLGLCLKRFQI